MLTIGKHRVKIKIVKTRWYHRILDKWFPEKPVRKYDVKNNIPLGTVTLNLYATYGGTMEVGIGSVSQNRPTW